jgi:hypothetical protein
MESTTGARSDQSMQSALKLWIESDGEGTFNPDSDAVDFLTLQVIPALSSETHSRFSLKFFDADEVFIAKTRIKVKKGSVCLENVFRSCGFARAPLRCVIIGASGRTSQQTLSEEETRQWISSPSFDGSYIDGQIFHITKSSNITDSPNFSSEVYVALTEMFMAAAVKELKPPLTIEIHDAQGRLFQAAEVQFNEHKYLAPSGLANCADLPFPVTIKLISPNGKELMTTVERPQ